MQYAFVTQIELTWWDGPAFFLWMGRNYPFHRGWYREHLFPSQLRSLYTCNEKKTGVNKEYRSCIKCTSLSTSWHARTYLTAYHISVNVLFVFVLLTSRSRVLLEKLISTQLVKKFPARWIQSTLPYFLKIYFNIILPSTPSGSSGLPIKIF